MKYNRIIVLGSRGMLGQMVCLYFNSQGFEVICYDKRFNEQNHSTYFTELNDEEDSIIINCIGKIKQKSDDTFDLLLSNSIFPLSLATSLKPSHLLIHPSTDCVFDGKTKFPYKSNEFHTATDVYGWSKSLSETAVRKRQKSLIIRVSIIGPDINSNKGLLSWFLSTKEGSILDGYSNHFWNGITTLEWCKRLEKIIEDKKILADSISKGLIQLGSGMGYSKHEMLNMFKDVYKKNVTIQPIEIEYLNRCLEPDIISVPLMEQLIEQKGLIDGQ